MSRGKFIVFEGVEGCGKTSQIQLTQAWLRNVTSKAVLVTREPGGTELGLDLRRLLLEVGKNQIAEVTELLLYAADRAQHVAQELKPNLESGTFILCDRYTDSTIAYQGYGRQLDINLINQLNSIATGGLESDLTLWLDLDVEIGLARKQGSGVVADRLEKETIAFHHRVQEGYSKLHASYPDRIVRVDASLSQEAVQEQIRAILRDRLVSWGFLNGRV
ncbi:dTMP kinase [Aetokthonos hydrillicola Thurmond2011]|jgi:dTMP kinase|uniref:Thymidylate kinase n=1 Tax=Aetokthonos hydrillicola Thurmond2011 TaxID=2712845 RepID=A0AAP5I6F9_9CYAN|nr:dTMP kinase [Aetokthonos hydrillicola]MBO3461882.1 dTMP kinase [Aetokthonos hydrillicola CCALA 1050]MBW4586776.1 dTMP kinase [Aetokthonos hydrillicola CCALA 1050]MDR9895867.1 dTMP kinase [Aetokthonos hydrillicola Thurmond2011]